MIQKLAQSITRMQSNLHRAMYPYSGSKTHWFWNSKVMHQVSSILLWFDNYIWNKYDKR